VRDVTRSPGARRSAVADSQESGALSDQGSLTSKHGELSGFSCVPFAERRGVTRIAVSGELDIVTSPRLWAALSSPADGTALVILDLSEATFMDASGLRVILGADGRLLEAGCRLSLLPGPRAVQRVFAITGTEDHLDFLRTAPPNG
jgi:anti-anti-sigma factor